MKLITLWQPWASAMAHEIKRIETRGWDTSYRGPLAIHAALAWNEECREFARTDRCWHAFEQVRKSSGAYRATWEHFAGSKEREKALRAILPFGAIIAVCDLVDCLPMEWCDRCDGCGWYEGGKTLQTACEDCAGGGVVPRGLKLSATEHAFGNYSYVRYALVTANTRRLVKPIPFKSRQGKLLDVTADIESALACPTGTGASHQ